MTLLYRYLDLFGADLLTLLPQLHKGPTDHDNPRTPDWLAWKPNGDLERLVRSRVLKCTRHGVWSFLWAPVEKKAKKKRKKTGGDDSDDEEDARVIAEDGWAVLEWLVALWSTSPAALLDQLHKPPSTKLQYDDAGVPLAIVRAAFLPTDPPTPLAVLFSRRATAATLLSLVIDLARPPKAQFHAQSLVLSLVTLFRVPAGQIPALSRAITEWNARAHILAVVLEDAAGVRKEREATRRSTAASRATSRAPSVGFRTGTRMTAPRSRSTTLAADKVLGVSLSTPFQAPDVNYALDLLELDGDDRSPCLAAELVSVLVANDPGDDAWLRLDDAYIGSHGGVLGRVLIMARKKADLANGRVPNVGVTVEFAKPPDETMDLDETQETEPLTASQLAAFKDDEEEEERRRSESELTPLSDEGTESRPPAETLPLSRSQRAQSEAQESESDESQLGAETQPLSAALRAQFEDDDSNDDESQMPAETLPLSRALRAQFAEDDDLSDDESQLPAETLPLRKAQRAQSDDDEDVDEESQRPAPAQRGSQSGEESVSDILRDAISPTGSENESQFPETLPMSRSQREQFDEEDVEDEDEDESQRP